MKAKHSLTFLAGLILSMLTAFASWGQIGEEWEIITPDGITTIPVSLPDSFQIELESIESPRTLIKESETRLIEPDSVEIITFEDIGEGAIPDLLVDGYFSVISEDEHQNIWISNSGNGLLQFKDNQWTTLRVEGGYRGVINSIQYDKQGSLWLSSSDEIWRYNGSEWRLYLKKDPTGWYRELQGWIVADFYGHIWATGRFFVFTWTDHGGWGDVWSGTFYRFDGKEWWEYRTKGEPVINGEFEHVLIDREGVLWATLSTSGWPDYRVGPEWAYNLVSFDGDEWTFYQVHSQQFRSRYIWCDSSNRLWISGRGLENESGVIIKDGDQWYKYNETETFGIPNAIAEDHLGRFWISSGRNGLGWLDGATWRYFGPIEEGKIPWITRTLFVDSRGTLWLGSDPLVRLNLPSFNTPVEANYENQALSFQLDQNYPNPFNALTRIGFDLPSRTSVELQVYNLTGQIVATLIDATLDAGPHQIAWNGRDAHGRAVASGVYIYRLVQQGQVLVREMVLLR